MDAERPGAERWVPPSADLPELREAVDGCRGCELWEPATQPVFSIGPTNARLMLVGEQPGDQEDRQGVPFVGPAGRLLRDALRAAGVDADQTYLTNAVKHFRHTLRGKRRIHEKPGVAHIHACRPWLDAELDVVRPGIVVCLGATAARAVLGHEVKIREVRGLVHIPARGSRPVLVTVHPASVVRLYGGEGWDEAFDALVADLSTAAEAIRWPAAD